MLNPARIWAAVAAFVLLSTTIAVVYKEACYRFDCDITFAKEKTQVVHSSSRSAKLKVREEASATMRRSTCIYLCRQTDKTVRAT